MTRWEHLTVYSFGEVVALGHEGWELVAVSNSPTMPRQRFVYFLKRPYR